MAENENKEDILNANDTFDINELASLNDDISTEFIEQLQSKLSQDVQAEKAADGDLFEEMPRIKQGNSDDNIINKLDRINQDIDDNFILKYKAKIKKQNQANIEASAKEASANAVTETTAKPKPAQETEQKNIEMAPTQQIPAEAEINVTPKQIVNPEKIEKLSGGNITEKPLTREQLEYSEALDYIDNNVNYSKYVIYIDPENKEFIESLTVKERKNLINSILREQEDVAITKKRLSLMQTFIKHAIVAIITISVAIPIIYTTINASLEASINNYRRSQTLFQTLYKPHGKVKKY